MPALNLDLNYFEHPKTKRLIGLLGPGAETYPIRLWVYCGKYHHKDGDLSAYSDREIEAVSGWTGHSGRLLQALLAVGFLEQTPDGFAVHDWREHAGHFAVYHERAKTAAKQRWGGHTPRAGSNASSIRSGATADASSILSIASSIDEGGRRARHVSRGSASDSTGSPATTVSNHASAENASSNAPAGQGRVISKRGTFVPPTLDEVSFEVALKGYRMDPSRFLNFYEAKGWMVGKNKMVNWRAALANWNASNGEKRPPVATPEENERLRAAAREAR